MRENTWPEDEEAMGRPLQENNDQAESRKIWISQEKKKGKKISQEYFRTTYENLLRLERKTSKKIERGKVLLMGDGFSVTRGQDGKMWLA